MKTSDGGTPGMRLLARFNRYATNPTYRPLAARVPGYANVIHTGRRTGRRYRTPVGVTWCSDVLTVALNYGRSSDWVRNVLAAGRFEIEHRGRTLVLTQPEVVRIGNRDLLRAIAEPQ